MDKPIFLLCVNHSLVISCRGLVKLNALARFVRFHVRLQRSFARTQLRLFARTQFTVDFESFL